MSYYRSPMGDYKTYGYAGDPGFLSSLWKGVKAGFGAVFAPKQPKPTVAPFPQPPGGFGGPMGPYSGGSFPGMGVRARPAGVPGAAVETRGIGAGGGKEIMVGGGYKGPAQMCPSGYHYAKDGSGRLVRNRRMNPANPRALRRAVRRMDGFEKLARRVLKNTHTIRRKR